MSLNVFSCNLRTQIPIQRNARKDIHGGIEKVQKLLRRNEIPAIITSPLDSLQRGNWVKLICGASFEDVADIRNLSLIYTLAGVDCIDCAAEESVVSAVNDGIEAAMNIIPIRRPWVMISVNDDEDLHFRKAEFDPENCPTDCSRPCENICPANAISSYTGNNNGSSKGGVLAERCYGCGRCLSICPYDRIRATTYIRDVSTAAKLLEIETVDAIEIHTSGSQVESFRDLWNGLGDSVNKLRLVAVSLPDRGDPTIDAMRSMYDAMKGRISCHNLWQLDGRPMSGDIGRGATKEAIAFAVRLASITNRSNGFLQLAGGTNAHTAEGLKKAGLFRTTPTHEIVSDSSHALISGIAFGGYARKIVGRVLSSIPFGHGRALVEDYPDILFKALVESLALVSTVKLYHEKSL